jgi:hypothetical protein
MLETLYGIMEQQYEKHKDTIHIELSDISVLLTNRILFLIH